MFERNVVAYRRGWWVFGTGLLEPIFYLFSLGIGLGALVGTVAVGGREIPYPVFVAPAMLAVSAMTGALTETTFNMFHRLKYAKLYDAILATPMRPIDIALGEISWALARGGAYSAAFLGLMAALGYIESWYGLLAFPAAILIGYAFGAVGMALSTFMRSWQHFDYVGFVIVVLFLLSATFFPLDIYPDWLQPVVTWTPLTQSVALIRELTTGELSAATVVHVVYLLVLSVAGSVGATVRIDRLLRP
ncbi:MAG: ABC transporter [Streptosporangiales bacterium]|nr:ABC transporter [Streptosporangiales bacterium]